MKHHIDPGTRGCNVDDTLRQASTAGRRVNTRKQLVRETDFSSPHAINKASVTAGLIRRHQGTACNCKNVAVTSRM
jgi:hypothetical protein